MKKLAWSALLVFALGCPAPGPGPSPSPPPTAPPPSTSTTTTTTLAPQPTPGCDAVDWKPTNGDPTCPREGEDSPLRPELERAVAASGVWPSPGSTTTLREEEIFRRVSPLLTPPMEACVYGTEEIALSLPGLGHSDVFDIKQSDGKQRSGAGSYRSRCRPARCTKKLPCSQSSPTPAPTPTATAPPPTPTPIPTHTPGACTWSHEDFVRNGEWAALKIQPGPGARINVDATARGCGRARCTAAGFVNRDCCPNFPEGHLDGPRCNVEMARPKWTVLGGAARFCNAGGEDGLVDNPLRNCVNGRGRIRVCGGESHKCVEAEF